MVCRGINNNYKFLLPEAVCFVYKLVHSVLMKNCHSTYKHQCTKYGDKHTQYREVRGMNNNYRFFCLMPFVISVLMKNCHITSVYQV